MRNIYLKFIYLESIYYTTNTHKMPDIDSLFRTNTYKDRWLKKESDAEEDEPEDDPWDED